MKLRRLFALCCLGLLAGCKSTPVPVTEPDTPQLTSAVKLLDHTIHSGLLARDMNVRIVIPAAVPSAARLPVIYLLHGAGVNYHDWTNYSQIASFAAEGFVLVLPNMPGTYYINQLDAAANRYEDYVTGELIPEVHRLIPYAGSGRGQTAVVGISRGGYGAAVLGLKHPDVFGFVGMLSPAIDFAERGFRLNAPADSMAVEHVFGPRGSETRKANDPFLLAAGIRPAAAPYFFIACGDGDVLLGPTDRFTKLLAAHHLPSEFHLLHGGHNWGTWDQAVPLLEDGLQKFVRESSSQGVVTR